MYDFSEISARRMSDPHLEVPNIFEKQAFVMFLLLKSSKSIFPVPGRRYLKIGFCYGFGRFAEFSQLSEPQIETPKSHMKLMNFSYEKINTPKVQATKTMPKSMVFH